VKQISKYCETGDRYQLTLSERTKIDMDELMFGVEEVSEYDSLIMIEQSLGFKINSRKMTVFEYYNYLEYLKKQAEQKQSNSKKND